MARTKETATKVRMTYFRLPIATWRRLKAIARAEQRTVSYVVRRAVEEFLDRRAA